MSRGSKFFLHVTFRKIVEGKKPESVLGTDMNEKSTAIVKLGKGRFIKIEVNGAKHIRDRYFIAERGTFKEKIWEDKG